MRIANVLALLLCCCVAYADDPATQPAETESLVIDASNKDALAAAMNKEAVVEGVVESAAWSGSGKVMQIRFKDTAESKFIAVVFERKKADFDAAYSGDVTKALPGAKVRLRGTIKDFKGKPEIVLDVPAQITIVEPPPATQPAN